MPTLHPDRLFPADPTTRGLARELYKEVANLPIVSPHGHCDPRWFAENQAFADPAQLFIVPDHYLHRMLHSQGVPPQAMGVPRLDRGEVETDPRKIWRRFAENFHLFRGTPSALWLTQAFADVFDFHERLSAASAEKAYDHIAQRLAQPEFRPRALFERFNIETLTTTDSPLDDLKWHAQMKADGWKGQVLTAFRPDSVVDPDFPGFAGNLIALGRIADCDVSSYEGYLNALRHRRAFFKASGCTSTDHGHASARTADLAATEAAALYDNVKGGAASSAQAELFRAQMLTEMAAMSVEDGLVMQIHPGSFRNHNPWLARTFGRDKGTDIPTATNYVDALKPLLDRFGNRADLTIILFTLDETTYSRELAPLAGHYPALKLGPPWWFFDSPEGMLRFRDTVTETTGYYNTVGFNDDTRAFPSIPARHDVARRIDCVHLARLVAEHRLDLDEAHEVAHDLAYRLAKAAYRI